MTSTVSEWSAYLRVVGTCCTFARIPGSWVRWHPFEPVAAIPTGDLTQCRLSLQSGLSSRAPEDFLRRRLRESRSVCRVSQVSPHSGTWCQKRVAGSNEPLGFNRCAVRTQNANGARDEPERALAGLSAACGL